MFEHEPTEPRLATELEAIERQLARLTPAAPRVDRDRLMYEAGMVAAQPRGLGYIAEPSGLGARRWFWPAATALMAAASLLLATMLVWQRHTYELALQSRMAQPAPTVEIPNPPIGVLPAVATGAQPGELRNAANTDWSTLLQPKPGYLGVRYAALQHGINAIESPDRTANTGPDAASDSEPTQRDLLQELLPAGRVLSPRS